MATHSSVLSWRIPGMEVLWAAIYRVSQSRTRLKRLSSSSRIPLRTERGWLRRPTERGGEKLPPRLRSGEEARRTPMQRGGDQEELPQVRGQGRRPRMPGCDTAGAAERTYPASEVRGSGREELPHIEVRGGGREELPQLRGQGQRPRMPSCDSAKAERSYSHTRPGVAAGRSYPHGPRPRVAGGRSNPTSKERWLRRPRRA